MYHYPKRREEEVNRMYGDRIRLYNVDFFANERTLEQYRYKGYNICVTDPPYNIGYKYDQYTDKMTEKDYLERLGSIVDCMPSVIIHYPEMLHKLSITTGKAPDRVISWTYNSNTPRQHRDIAFYGVKPNMHAVKQDYQNLDDIRIRRLINNGSVGCNLYDWWHIEQVKNVSSQKTAHPCQIPLTVMKNIIGILPPDAVIVDPFGGSGTTAVACQELGRDCDIYEISQDYCDIISNRLKKNAWQIKLF